MIGLRSYPRDPALPATLGDPGLVGPEPSFVVDAVGAHLVRPDAEVAPVAATLEYARWKPGASSTWGFRVELSDGDERFVTVKRYRSADKVLSLSGRKVADEHDEAALGPLRAFHADPAGHLALWAFPADRALRGLGRALDGARAARLLERTVAAGEELRKRGARVELLRYKPERRAVLHLKVPRHGGRETRSVHAIFRVHPLEKARAIVAAREACPVADELGPRLLAHELETGTVLEERLRGNTVDPESFGHAARVGAILAALHGAPAPAAAPDAPDAPDATHAEPWIARLPRGPGSGVPGSGVPALAPAPRVAWIHGDLHPDQYYEKRDRRRLFDLDELRVGDPTRDLASWIADHLAAADLAFEEAAAPLLEGYEGAGGRPALDRLRTATAQALVGRAAGCLRRLERGGVERARELLDRASRLVAGGAS